MIPLELLRWFSFKKITWIAQRKNVLPLLPFFTGFRYSSGVLKLTLILTYLTWAVQSPYVLLTSLKSGQSESFPPPGLPYR